LADSRGSDNLPILSIQSVSPALCSEKGGACPDCIFVPETSCIAQHRLLCRSTVAGGQKAIEDHTDGLIAGYFDVARSSE
jgi:hypothetical protein